MPCLWPQNPPNGALSCMSEPCFVPLKRLLPARCRGQLPAGLCIPRAPLLPCHRARRCALAAGCWWRPTRCQASARCRASPRSWRAATMASTGAGAAAPQGATGSGQWQGLRPKAGEGLAPFHDWPQRSKRSSPDIASSPSACLENIPRAGWHASGSLDQPAPTTHGPLPSASPSPARRPRPARRGPPAPQAAA